ncbi:PilN domain-containing protein [Chromatium okenii]|jgi:general secretion pathway protein L|uniref:PilN domain-containing protein n=1 Tax=Chromatium okenii TaxID=61644 RepID=UPI0026F3677B|nr:PilN domain-containing protein [Chromatium okenii]MBV5310770.1 pilus assembly protein PilM [Chromatium okenii]
MMNSASFSLFSKTLSRINAAQFAACLPATMQRALAQRQRTLLITVTDATTAQLTLLAGENSEAVGEIDLERSAPLPEVVLSQCRKLSHCINLRIPAEAVLTRRVSLPAQVQSNLPQVMRHELDRLSPFQAEDVVFDYALLPSSAPQPTRITLELALCRRDRVTDWLTYLNRAGAPIERIDWAGAWAGANLLPPEQRPRRRSHQFGLTHGLFIAAMVLMVATLITPIWQKTRHAEALDAELRRVRAQAIAVDEVRQALTQARESGTAVLRQQQEQTSLLALLLELTERLPDDTWIQTLEYNQGLVDVRGESAQATALIALLEQAPSIEGVAFKSPVTQIARTGKERFNLSFRVVNKKTE